MVCRQSRRSQRSRRRPLNPGGPSSGMAQDCIARQPPRPRPQHADRKEKWAIRDDGSPMSTAPRHQPWEGQPPACPKNVLRGNHAALPHHSARTPPGTPTSPSASERPKQKKGHAITRWPFRKHCRDGRANFRHPTTGKSIIICVVLLRRRRRRGRRAK